MTPQEMKTGLEELLKETTAALGGTDQTYIGLLKMLQKAGQLSLPSRLIQGQLVFFKYHPVSESFLSRNTYYDTYPLVLITEVYRGGFEGVNVHHIDPEYRKFLFDALMRDLPVIKASESWRNRLMVDYDRLDSRRKFRFFKPCYRRYLWKGMKRRPAVIPFYLWEDMVKAHASRFVDARPVTVYRNTRTQVIRGDR